METICGDVCVHPCICSWTAVSKVKVLTQSHSLRRYKGNGCCICAEQKAVCGTIWCFYRVLAQSSAMFVSILKVSHHSPEISFWGMFYCIISLHVQMCLIYKCVSLHVQISACRNPSEGSLTLLVWNGLSVRQSVRRPLRLLTLSLWGLSFWRNSQLFQLQCRCNTTGRLQCALFISFLAADKSLFSHGETIHLHCKLPSDGNLTGVYWQVYFMVNSATAAEFCNSFTPQVHLWSWFIYCLQKNTAGLAFTMLLIALMPHCFLGHNVFA